MSVDESTLPISLEDLQKQIDMAEEEERMAAEAVPEPDPDQNRCFWFRNRLKDSTWEIWGGPGLHTLTCRIRWKLSCGAVSHKDVFPNVFTASKGAQS